MTDKYFEFLSSFLGFMKPWDDLGHNKDYDLDYTDIICKSDPLGIDELNLLLVSFCNGKEFIYFTSYYDDMDDKRLEEFCESIDNFVIMIDEERNWKRRDAIICLSFDSMSAFSEFFRVPHVFSNRLKSEFKNIDDYYVRSIFGQN